MITARVAGSVVATRREDGMAAPTYLLVEDCDQAGAGRKDYLVALDAVGAERGQLVLVAQGSSCHWSSGTAEKPVDALIVAIVDTIDEGGVVKYSAAGTQAV
jgi:microcompartment protein CcmK/EutM